jgi:ubiquinone/menaquinone biosynthesis C-methylase UbiE
MPRVTRAYAESVDAARARYPLWEYDHTPFAAGTRILDVGFGDGDDLRALAARGCTAVGIDVGLAPDSRSVLGVARLLLARAEHLPFRDASFDGAVMKVVLPLTDERMVVREVARVLRPGAVWELTVHGIGYYLRMLLLAPLRRRIYAARTILNTLVYRLTGARWLVGTTIYQSTARLRRDLRRHGIRVTRVTPSPTFAGLPYFIYMRVEKAGGPAATSADGRGRAPSA